MIYQEFPAGEDLFVHLHRPDFQPTQYEGRGQVITVISKNEYHLNDISANGSHHEVVLQGRQVVCELDFEGGAADESGRISRYGGPIVIYVNQSGKFFICPNFDFDAKYTLVTEGKV